MFQDTQSKEITKEMNQLLADTVSSNPEIARAAIEQLKAALVIRTGTLYGDTVSGIFEMKAFNPGEPIEFALDVVGPSDVKYHIAHTVPFTGHVPHRTIEGDYLAVKVYKLATSVDWSRHMAKWSRWDVVGRAMSLMEAGMVRKRNNDGWHTIISAASTRGIGIADTTVAAGLFSKRLVALAQTVMRRNAGGNSTSLDRGKLTHIAMSPESLQDIRSWDLTQVDEITRREIFLAGDEYSLTKIFGVTLVDIDEFGVGQEYENYFENTLGATVGNSKNEIAIGLDLAPSPVHSFLMPWIKQDNGQFLQMFEDHTMLRMGRQGYWAEGYMGVAQLDNRKVILLYI